MLGVCEIRKEIKQESSIEHQCAVLAVSVYFFSDESFGDLGFWSVDIDISIGEHSVSWSDNKDDTVKNLFSPDCLCNKVKEIINSLYDKIEGESTDIKSKKMRDICLSLISPLDFAANHWERLLLPGEWVPKEFPY